MTDLALTPPAEMDLTLEKLGLTPKKLVNDPQISEPKSSPD